MMVYGYILRLYSVCAQRICQHSNVSRLEFLHEWEDNQPRLIRYHFDDMTVSHDVTHIWKQVGSTHWVLKSIF